MAPSMRKSQRRLGSLFLKVQSLESSKLRPFRVKIMVCRSFIEEEEEDDDIEDENDDDDDDEDEEIGRFPYIQLASYFVSVSRYRNTRGS